MQSIFHLGREIVKHYGYCPPAPSAVERLKESVETPYGMQRKKPLGLEILFIQLFSPKGKKLISEIKIIVHRDHGNYEYRIRKAAGATEIKMYSIVYSEEKEELINSFLRRSYKLRTAQVIIKELGKVFTEPDESELWSHAVKQIRKSNPLITYKK